VERIVGQGAYGRVFRAQDERTGEAVALKEFTRGSRGSDGFLRELGVLFELRHPAILECRTVLVGGPYRYLVYEFMEAGSLRDWMNAGHTQECLRLFRMAAAGVSHAHECKVVHRDLKPENVLLTRKTGELLAKVSDFGISAVGSTAEVKSHVGSPAYMAPEQFYDTYDLRVDIYALGTMLYEILCGSRPFYGSPAQIMLSHLQKEVPYPPWMPPAFKALLERALAKDPEDRFETVDDFLVAFDQAFATEGDRLEGEGWPVDASEVAALVVTRDAVVSLHDDRRARVFDRQGRAAAELEQVDELLGAEEFYALRRGDRVTVKSAQGERTHPVPEDAKVALSTDGSLAVTAEGGARLLISPGSERVLAEPGSGVVDVTFAGDTQATSLLVADADGACRIVVEDEDDIPLPEPVSELVGHGMKEEWVARVATDRSRLLLVTRDRVVSVQGPKGPLSADDDHFFGALEDGRLATINVASGRVARTVWESPLAAVAACCDGFVWATRDGRLLSLR